MKLKRLIIIILILFSVVPTIIITGICSINFVDNAKKMMRENVQIASEIQSGSIQSVFEQWDTEVRIMTKLPVILSYLSQSNSQIHTQDYGAYYNMSNQIMQICVEEKTDLCRASLVNKDNIVISSNIEAMIGEISPLDSGLVAKLISAESIVTDISIDDHDKHFTMGYPVIEEDQFVGYMVWEFNINFFQNLIEQAGLYDTGIISIFDQNFNAVSTNSEYLIENVYSIKENNTLGEAWQTIDFDSNPNGFIEYSIENKYRVAYYSKIPTTGWIVLSSVETSEFYAPVQQIIFNSVVIIIAVILIVIFVFIFAVRYFTRPLNYLLDCIRRIERGDYSQRVTYDKNNEFGEISRAFQNLMDKIQSDHKELSLKEERYRIVSEQSDDIIFEFNLVSKTIYYSLNYEKKFGYTSIKDNYPDCILAEGIVYQDDIAAFLQLYQDIFQGVKENKVEVRLRKVDGTFIWCSIFSTTIYDDDGNPFKAIGKIVDINTKKLETAHLIEKAERDLMTGLYNKATTELLIKDCLKGSDEKVKHALFAIDVDNFKHVNDKLGHLFGDEVLKEITKKTSALFRSTDIVGRIGGDEFVVFMKDFTSEDQIVQHAKKLTQIFHSTYSGKNNSYKISGSVGISIYPKDGNNFKTLFECADRALYTAKHRGKDCYQMYDPETSGKHYVIQMENLGLIRNANIMETQNLSEYIFHILYEATDTQSAVSHICEIVGKYYHVSRVYVFENSQDNTYCTNTFEWCNAGIEPQIDSLQKVDYDLLQGYFDNFNDDGIFYCSDISTLKQGVRDILEPQKISSLLQCTIINDGKIRGYVGFDQCNEPRLWTKDEVNTLSFIAKILSVFLIKLRIQTKLEKSYYLTKSVLDTQNLWTYVINDQYELLFINKKTHGLAPDAQIGDRCYSTFYNGRMVPCDRCPVKALHENHGTCTMEIYNDHFNVWTSASAAKMLWNDNENANLICCVDISKYKE